MTDIWSGMKVGGIMSGDGQRQITGHEAEIRQVIDAFPFFVLLVDSDHRIIMTNTALNEAFGLNPEDVIGQYCPKLIHGSDKPFKGCPLEEAHRTGQGLESELYSERRDAWMLSGVYPTPFISEKGLKVYLHTALDITAKKKADEALEQLREELERTVERRTRELASTNERLQQEIVEREKAQEAIHRLAYYDILTGLPNRTHFNELLREHMDRVQKDGARIGFAVLDLDGFKRVNDHAGHHVGDLVLQLVGMRLDETLRKKDLAARMGGDEFMFMFPDIRDRAELDGICLRLLSVFDDPFIAGDESYTISCSIGSAMFPDDGEDECILLRLADRAMFTAKGSGKNRHLSTTESQATAAG